MSLGRRAFLQFSLGAGAGLTLSPLPWKLLDDSSIWSQTFRGLPIEVPVPPAGEVTIKKTVCALCPGGCGISVRKVKERAVKIEGTEGHPINDGGICPMGAAGLYQIYGGARVTKPLKRTGERGDGNWSEVSWADAISDISTQLNKTRKEGLSHTVACLSGSDQGTVPQLLKRLLSAYGSPNFFSMPSLRDTEGLALRFMHGKKGVLGYDLENADYVLSFGSGLIEGWGSPVSVFRAHSALRDKAREGKAKLIQLESRLSNTAAKADKWIPIEPGTEAAVALGLAHVIVKEMLYNKQFIDNNVFGFEDWVDLNGKTHRAFKRMVLEDWPVDKVSAITAVPAAQIFELARGFAKSSAPLAVAGRGKGMTPSGLNEFMAIYSLNALVGNVNKKGGVCVVPEIPLKEWPDIARDGLALAGLEHQRIDGADTKQAPVAQSLFNMVPDLINQINQEKMSDVMSALFIYNANPCYTLHNTQQVASAFNKIPLIISFASHKDETAKYADYILPNHTNLERYDDIYMPPGLGFPVIGLSQPVITPQYDTRHTGDVIIELAKAMGGTIAESFKFANYETLLKERLAEKWDTLVAEGFWKDDSFKLEGDRGFDTPTERFELFVIGLQRGGFISKDDNDYLPYYKSFPMSGEKDEYPLILIQTDSMRLANGTIATPPLMTKTVSDSVLKKNDIVVEINPQTAATYGLLDGDKALLKTPTGKTNVRVSYYNGLKPGVIAMPTGLGHTAYDDYICGKGTNSNDIIGTVTDPVVGFDIAWGCRAEIKRIIA
ncbi:MAG: molybdopterin-dependent oxidoreductase [Pseudomonadota bacterium]